MELCTLFFQLPRIFNWKVLLISGGIYGALYTYNWSTFNPKDEFHKQVSQNSEQDLLEDQSVHDVLIQQFLFGHVCFNRWIVFF